MASEVVRRSLHQKHVVYEIRKKFGEEFTHRNRNGNWAIDKDVLAAFREVTDDTVVWEKGARLWRLRRPSDPPGRSRS
jgi:hypothetical protein